MLPPNVCGNVRCWDLKDGDAQYMHSIPDETYDAVYSSHCLEHMRNLDIAFKNWLRICKTGGYLYICVPHEIYYEKSHWPSIYNTDHKHSFTVDVATDMPENVVLKDFLKKYDGYIEVVSIRENLLNYDFDASSDIDQTANFEERVCAQIDCVIKKVSKIDDSPKKKFKENMEYHKDCIIIMFPIRMKIFLKSHAPECIKRIARKVRKK